MTAFAGWPHQLPEEIEVYGARLPGREGRQAEPALCGADSLADSLIADLLELARGPYVLFGHSMGGLLAFEIARQAQLREDQPPSLLCVSGIAAPDRLRQQVALHRAPDEEILHYLATLNPGADEADRASWVGALPVLRADLAVCENYRFTPGEPLSCPISVFAGTSDPSTSPPELMRWGFHTRGDCNVRVLPGGHFFLDTSRAQLLRALGQDLSALRLRELGGW